MRRERGDHFIINSSIHKELISLLLGNSPRCPRWERVSPLSTGRTDTSPDTLPLQSACRLRSAQESGNICVTLKGAPLLLHPVWFLPHPTRWQTLFSQCKKERRGKEGGVRRRLQNALTKTVACFISDPKKECSSEHFRPIKSVYLSPPFLYSSLWCLFSFVVLYKHT